MLNELFLMYKGLEEIGESPEIKHNDIQSPGKGATFRVLLDVDGNASKVELMSEDQIKDTWTLGNSNKNQFPAAKLVRPLFPDAYKSHKKWKEKNKNPDDQAYRLSIKKLMDDYSVNLGTLTCWPDYRNKIIIRKEQLKVMDGGDAECVYQLFDRYLKSANGLSILKQVAESLINSIDNADRYALNAIGDALFGDSVDSKGNIDGKRVTLILDFLPKSEIDIFATSRQWVPYITEALLQSEKDTEKSILTCALTGNVTETVKRTFPKEKLGIVGNTIIFAKNAGTSGPTVKRYDKSGSEAFSLSNELSQKLAASIVFLSSRKLKGKTWSKLPSSTGTSPSLLLAYCRDNLSLAVTPLITGDSEIEDFDDYQDATETVLKLYDKSDCSPDALVDIAEIIVLDKANRKVNFSSTSTLNKVRQAAKEWGSACTNTPDFKLLANTGKTKKLLDPWPIAPQQLIYLSRKKYIRDGQVPTSVPAINFSDMMKLFFSESINSKQLASRCLIKLSSQYEPLFSHCALSKVQSVLVKNAQVKTNPKNNTQALNAVTLLAVLLYKTGRIKEVYMNGFAYQLGQLCSAMDELHIGYCKSMRGGKIPNTLIGNLTYGIALQSPIKALAVLASRIKPYETWAKKEAAKSNDKPSEDKAIKAGVFANKWLSGQSEKLSVHLSKNDKELTDSYKAELMLGYLAGRPFGAKKSQTNSNESEGEE